MPSGARGLTRLQHKGLPRTIITPVQFLLSHVTKLTPYGNHASDSNSSFSYPLRIQAKPSDVPARGRYSQPIQPS